MDARTTHPSRPKPPLRGAHATPAQWLRFGVALGDALNRRWSFGRSAGPRVQAAVVVVVAALTFGLQRVWVFRAARSADQSGA